MRESERVCVHVVCMHAQARHVLHSQVRAYAGVSEVSVVYRLNEFSIELFVHLPTNYPLQPPSIREGKRVKVETSQWRKWMLQLNVFIANQVYRATYRCMMQTCIYTQ